MASRMTHADLQAALPDVTSTLQLPGLHRPVDICRDRWGIPHIRAENAPDAFFAQGFVTAQDRLWHMDYDRQRALGRWAEWAGPAVLPEDRLMRAFRLERAARADLAVSSLAAQAMLASYTAGVNAFITTTRTLPIEYTLLDTTPEAWEPWHCLAVYKVRNMLMGTYEMKLWRARLALGLGPEKAAALFQGAPQGGLVTVPPGETSQGPPLECLDALAAATAQLDWLGEVNSGSNAWVIAGARTASGLPLVAGDSHRALDTPGVYYQIHIACPTFRVSGYAVPGLPGAPHFSHTEYVAWGMTHGYGDYQDLFLERFRTQAGRLEYAYKDAWLPAEVSHARLLVRGAAPEEVEVVATHHGSIIAGHPRAGTGLAFSHTGTNSGTPWADSVYQLLLARSADEVEEAMREWTEPVNNVVYADVHGAYGYRYRGRLPLRPMANGWVPVPGWTGEYEWDGQIPFEAMPQTRNPQAGYAVTCNQRVTTAEYPYYINTYFTADYRARRITARLQALETKPATVEDMTAMHADRVSIPAQAFRQVLAQAQPTDPQVAAARELLLAWDGSMERDSVAATLYGTARTYWLADVLQLTLGRFVTAATGPSGTGRGAPTHATHIYNRAVSAMASGDPWRDCVGAGPEGPRRDCVGAGPLGPWRDCVGAGPLGPSLLPPGQTWPGLIESALIRAVAELRQRLGDDMRTWIWGQVHQTRPRHPLSRLFPECATLLDPPQVAAGGDGDTPQQGAYAGQERFVVTMLSVNRYVFDPADWRRSRWIVPLGASGHPGSPHFADQAQRWADVETIPQWWDWDDLSAAAETRQQLLPSA